MILFVLFHVPLTHLRFSFQPVTAKVYLLTPSSSQLPRATATNLAPANMAGGHSSPHPSSLGPPSIEELRDEEECYLCDSPANVRFSPCGHTTMCSACAPRAKKCPICRVSGLPCLLGHSSLARSCWFGHLIVTKI